MLEIKLPPYYYYYFYYYIRTGIGGIRQRVQRVISMPVIGYDHSHLFYFFELLQRIVLNCYCANNEQIPGMHKNRSTFPGQPP